MRLRFLMPLLALTSFLVPGCVSVEQAPSSDGGANSSNQQAAPSKSTPKSSAGMPGSGKMAGQCTQIPDITWGGDYATHYCAGGDQTRDGTICAEYGQNLCIVNGDDMSSQLADYKSGKSPFLRGTFVMVGVNTQQLCQTDPGACPQFVFQMTWSAGDHLVVRDGITDLKQLKKKTIAIQRGGPHMGFLDAILADAGLKWSDVNIEWVDALSGPGSPVELFERNENIAAAFAITPDMYALTGGPDSTCDGAECSVVGAHVLVSTADRRRTIADSYFVRTDWAQAHPDELRNFAAAWMYSSEKVKDLMNAYDGSGSDEYMALMQYAVDYYDANPTFEDADGLYRDATFVGHAGNLNFMDPTNPEGFATFVDRSNAVAKQLKLSTGRFEIQVANVDWNHAVFSGLQTKGMTRQVSINAEASRRELERMTQEGIIDDNTTLSFTASFAPNQTTFDASQYSDEFDELLDLSQKYSTASLTIRCHADPLKAVVAVLKAGTASGKITRNGTKGNYTYFYEGRPLDVQSAKTIAQMLHDPRFNTLEAGNNPSELADAALTLSEGRCRTAKDSFLSYANRKGVPVNADQFVVQGVGIREPVVMLPRSDSESAYNRRVEFAIVRGVMVEDENPSYDW